METFIGFAVEVLRLIPLTLTFYVPALMGLVLVKERGKSYKFKAALVFVIGFGGIVATQLLLRSASVLQAAQIITISVVQIAAALLLAALTAYKLAD